MKKSITLYIIGSLLGLVLITNCEKEEFILICDGDGNIYKSVVIGTQTWLTENLKTTKYNNGVSIPLVTDNNKWSTSTTPAYCFYDNDSLTYKNAYGALYNWYTVETGLLCPDGYHVPTDAEWDTLLEYLGGQYEAGGRMKEIGTLHWEVPNTNATNKSGFSALPGGQRSKSGTFTGLKTCCRFWSSTNSSTSWVRDRSLFNNRTVVGSDGWDKRCGFSVRCIKDKT